MNTESCVRHLTCARLRPAGGTLLTLVAPFVNIQFLGSSLTFMMVRGGPAAVCFGWFVCC
jgi:hypothetical protein